MWDLARMRPDLQTGLDRTYRGAVLATKSTIKTAEQLLDRFFRDAEGRTNRQLDVYFTLQDMALPRDKSDPALDFLTSRGLINTFGPDIAYLTDKGAQAVVEEINIGKLPKEIRDFVQKPVQPQAPEPAVAPAAEPPPETGSPRPDRAQVTHVDPDGREFTLELGRICTIGRSAGNDIQVSDQRASKRHAELRWDDGRFVLVDLGSANGTLLNGEYVDQSVLQHDDELVIGRTMLIFQAPELIPAPRHEHTTPEGRGTEVAEAYQEPQKETERPAPEPPPAAPEPIRVVKGRPEAQPAELFASAPATDEAATGDLFADEAEAITGDTLFREPELQTEAATPEAPDALFGAEPAVETDLFEPEREPELGLFEGRPAAPADQDLFGNESSKTAESPDLFMGQDDEATIGQGPIPSMDELSPDMTVEVPAAESFGADFPSIEPIEPIEDLDVDPRTVSTEEPTFDGSVLLENQPVVEERKEEPDAATLMMSRQDLFDEEAKPPSELPRWGEDGQPPLGSHPDFAEVVPAGIDGESLPVATPSLVNLEAVGNDGPTASLFHQTLAAIKEHAERADLPDRDALLGAIDLLEQHAYVRVALALIERDR